MSVPFYANIDLTKNQLLNALFQILPSAPSNPVEGLFYYNSTDKTLYFFDGTNWKAGGDQYILPVATASTLGGVKVGYNLNIDTNGSLFVRDASTSVKGLVQLVDNLTSESDSAALTASQGKALKDLIDAINTTLGGLGTASTKNTGEASGNVPILDANGKLSSNVIPSIAITDVFEASTQAEMLALDAQMGDVCIRTDENKIYILKQTPASTLANWIPIEIPVTVESVNGKTGVVVLTGLDITLGSDITYSEWNNSNNSASNKTIASSATLRDALNTLATSISSITGELVDKKTYSTDIGNGTNTSFTISHGLVNKNVIVQIYDNTTGDTVYADVSRISNTQIKIDFSKAPTSNQFRVLVMKCV